MKDKVLGNYTIRKSGNLKFKKAALNFWDSAPSMSDKEKKEDLEDLGFNPLE